MGLDERRMGLNNQCPPLLEQMEQPRGDERGRDLSTVCGQKIGGGIENYGGGGSAA